MPKSHLRLLLVEDNRGDARLLEEMIREPSSHTAELTLVESMSDAEEHLANHAFDVVLLDLGLPDAQGLDVVRRAHVAAPHVSLVVLTGLDDDQVALQALNEGAQDYLVKGQMEASGLLRAFRYAMERKKMEEALVIAHKRSEEGWTRLAAIHEATPDLVSISDPEGRLLYVNRGGRRMLGLDESSDITGRTMADFLPDPSTHPVQSVGIPTAVREGIWRAEVELVSVNGETISVSQVVLAHKRADGSVEFLSTIARDMTESNRSDDALRVSEGRLQQLLDSNIIGVHFWKTDGQVLDANEPFLEMIGYTRDELHAGRVDWIALTPPEFARADEKALAEMASTGSCVPYEKQLIRKDGSRVSVLVGAALQRRESDTGSAFVMDVSDRKKSEARLYLQSAALNAAANAMVITELDLCIAWINPAFTELTGFSEAESIGRDSQELLRSGVHDDRFYETMRETLIEGKSWRGEMTNRRKSGLLYREAQIITPVKDVLGNITHFVSIKTDLTAQRLMEAQLRQAQKMEAVGQLAAGVAHEFNNLLQALMAMAAIMRLRAGNSEIATIGTDMEVQIKRGAALTQQLLLFSRDVAIEKTGLDLRDQVQKASVLLRQVIPENIRIVVETSSEPISVQGDAGQLQQVILNLAINARDAMPAGGTLTLRATRAGQEVFLDVEDTGEGMPESTRAHIFEPFFTTKELGKGTGLGLAVVHGIVAEHDGRIEVRSGEGEGTRFRVVLPASLTEVLPATEAPEAEMLFGSGSVLLVEDQEGVRDGISVLLEMIGYEVVAVGSGEEALALPAEDRPDLLLSDMTLPGISGSVLGDLLRQRWPDLKVVLMSGYIEEALREDAGRRAWHFLQKPFELSELAASLRDALRAGDAGTSRSIPADPESLRAEAPAGAPTIPRRDPRH
jgi:two-component system cell cycle sensor histidine kinase/response regulator CckA